MQILSAHIREGHFEFLSRFGLFHVERESWNKTSIKRDKLKSLVCDLLNLPITDDFRSEVVIKTKSPELPSFQFSKDDSLAEYFKLFWTEIIGEVLSYRGGKKLKRDIVILNLMPFNSPKGAFDKIVIGLRQALNELSQKNIVVIIMLRSARNLFNSKWIIDTVENNKYGIEFLFVDYMGFAIDKEGRTQGEIPRQRFFDIIRIDHDDLYKKLIWQTNGFIGHYLLRDSHVRTHYDLVDFIDKDSVFEYIIDEITSFVSDKSNVVILYAGLEEEALIKLGTSLIRFVPSKFAHLCSASELHRISDKINTFEAILILSDIVNTGNTILEAHKSVAEIFKATENIFCYAVLSMANTPPLTNLSNYRVTTELKRTFYPSDDCFLCKIEQPKIEVKNASDFKIISNEQLTPYDFWEMVTECGALKRNETEHSGRTLTYRIETENISKKYEFWLKSFIYKKYKTIHPTILPTKILTVKNSSSVTFSLLVAKALGMPVDIAAIERKDLDKAKVDDSLSKEYQYDQFLIVDDGINKGTTIEQLYFYASRRGAKVIGFLVFDCRLDLVQRERLETNLGHIPIITMYDWSGRIVENTRTTQ